MEKPVAVKKEYFDIMELFGYVEEKYNLEVSFMDLWHWFVDAYEPDNGSFIEFDTTPEESDDDDIKIIKEKLAIEYGNEIPLYVSW
jgi:hypothetical protein